MNISSSCKEIVFYTDASTATLSRAPNHNAWFEGKIAPAILYQELSNTNMLAVSLGKICLAASRYHGLL